MSEPILHHYEFSTFSQKVRTAFGIKGLRWQSVDIPGLPPRPLLSTWSPSSCVLSATVSATWSSRASTWPASSSLPACTWHQHSTPAVTPPSIANPALRYERIARSLKANTVSATRWSARRPHHDPKRLGPCLRFGPADAVAVLALRPLFIPPKRQHCPSNFSH